MSVPSTSNTCVTTTAMPRPELIEPTYQSFQEHMPWLNFKKMTLYLSVDRFPDTSGIEETKKVIEIAKSYFGNVICRNELQEIQNIPCFPAAVKWLFTNVEHAEYVFHLEDDWLLLSDIPEDVVSVFNQSEVMQIGFRAWKISEPRFVLSPSIMRRSFCNLVGKSINTTKNPETQIRGINPYNPSKAFIYWPFEDEKVILKDTGRGWMKNTTFARGDDGFTKWAIVRNPLALKREQFIRDQNAEIDTSKL